MKVKLKLIHRRPFQIQEEGETVTVTSGLYRLVDEKDQPTGVSGSERHCRARVLANRWELV